MSYIDEVRTLKEWKDCQLTNVLTHRHNQKVLIFKNKKNKIRLDLAPVNFESQPNAGLYKGVFYDIELLEGGNCYAIGLSDLQD